jgi:hypothetical protein
MGSFNWFIYPLVKQVCHQGAQANRNWKGLNLRIGILLETMRHCSNVSYHIILNMQSKMLISNT